MVVRMTRQKSIGIHAIDSHCNHYLCNQKETGGEIEQEAGILVHENNDLLR